MIQLVCGSVEATRIVGLALDDNVKIVPRKPSIDDDTPA